MKATVITCAQVFGSVAELAIVSDKGALGDHACGVVGFDAFASFETLSFLCVSVVCSSGNEEGP